MGIKTLGKYELLEVLGRGGYGTVYRGRETVLDVERAVKVLHPALAADPEFIERFRREARLAARLEHPNIVPVYELDEQQGTYFLAMKYLPGGALKDRLAQEGRFAFARALQITRQVAAALDFAHAQGLVHRDVKPGNILLEADGTARLGDFGFAKALSGAGSAALSTSGGMIGTPAYMAPETWRSQPAAPAADIYSLACVFYEMLTGEVLFDGDSPPEIMTKHVLDGPQLPSVWPEGTSKGVGEVLSKALSREPRERHASAGEFVRALEVTTKETLKASETFRVLPADPSPSPLKGEGAGERGQGGKLHSPLEGKVLLPSPSGGSSKERWKGSGVRSVSSPFPWKWMGISAGVLMGLALLIGMIIKSDNDRRALQTAQARANQTAESQDVGTLSASFTDSSLSPSLTPSLTPSPLPPSLTPTPYFEIVATQLSPRDSMVLIYIPAGTFLMGSESGPEDEKPIHSVTLDAFWMDQTEVTNGMYAQCVTAGACSPPYSSASSTRQSYYGEAAYANYPVTSVDWNRASAYCTWAGRRLPTEAEWEYAARGRLVVATYPWGVESPVCTLSAMNGAQKYNCSPKDTIAVGSFTPNGYGLYDIAGNVWEYVADWYGAYSSTAVDNPSGPITGPYKILRGGSWSNMESNLRVSSRFGTSLVSTHYSFGFRCARSP